MNKSQDKHLKKRTGARLPGGGCLRAGEQQVSRATNEDAAVVGVRAREEKHVRAEDVLDLAGGVRRRVRAVDDAHRVANLHDF